ncbi:hypothetical protein [Achromobacter xylosoxidans]|uniref:hypothetical protein n=1 Tax=Alcaligenes xylosoxydans xylosoxydans TaxID=85698 RepID=UPI0022B8D7AF|nr:hypothetical protein [Achromobacter xylosoxidans]MCZ8436838.1 hypothetical protein [Achromobacter xylosoxidans]
MTDQTKPALLSKLRAPVATSQAAHVEALRDLRLGVEMDRHHLPDGDAKIAALDAALALLRAPVADEPPGGTRWPVLRAMARNYTAGKHTWDALDAEACEQAAEEIRHLRAALASAPVQPPNGWACAHKNKVANAAAYVWYCKDCQKFVNREPGDTVQSASAPVAEPEWIDDPHDIEQGMMRNPKYVAPVAGEAQPVAWRYQTPTGWHATTDAQKAVSLRAHHPVEPLYAAPQASALAAEYTRGRADGFDAGQSAALEKAAQVAYEALHPTNPRSDWTEYAEHSAQHAAWAARSIRALKQPQADKDGGQQRAGDAERWRWATATDENAQMLYTIVQAYGGDQKKINERADFYRAALSATQAEQGERDA